MALIMSMFLLAIPFLLFILLKHNKSNNGICNLLPPGPPALPLIGHLHMQLFDNSNAHIFLWKLSKKYGSLMSLRFGFKPILVVSSAKMAEEIMKTHDLDFCSRPNQRGTSKLSYNGLDLAFAPYSKYWREMRKICVVHLFSRVEKYRLIREDEVARLVEKVLQLCVDSKPVNLSEAITCLSSSIVCRLSFGKRYDEEGAERSRFSRLLKDCEATFTSFSFADYFPFMGWVDGFTGLLTRLEKTFKDFDTLYQQLIDEHLDPNRLTPQEEDILDVLLRIRTDRDFPFDLSIDHIKAILMNVFVGGTDPAAVTMIWVMSLLMKNSKCLKRAQAEVRDLIGRKGFVNEDDVQSLSYLKAVVKETFRLQPTAPLLLPRETLGKCSIGGYQVPAKTAVYVNVWAIGRDPETWENPEVFCPERFNGSSIDYKGLNFELILFGTDRRVCPGLRMGVAVFELAIANLLYKFDWEMPDGMNEEDIDLESVPDSLLTRKMILSLWLEILIVKLIF